MIPEAVLKALNLQVKAELDSAYMYLAAGSYLDEMNFEGMGAWLVNHAKEEYRHALRIRNYVTNKGESCVFGPLEKPISDWGSPFEVWQQIYNHELLVTEMILNLVETAKKYNDTTTKVFLNWYVNEQVEEENITRLIMDKVELLSDDVGGLVVYDNWLKTQVPASDFETIGKEDD